MADPRADTIPVSQRLQELMKPQHKHDCDKCQYVATDSTQGKYTDWYVCPGIIASGSVVGRHSSRGADYYSVPVEILDDKDYDIAEVFEAGILVMPAIRIVAQAMLARWRCK